MAVEIRTTGDGKRIGGPAEVISYSTREEATPITFESLQGAVGSVTFNVNAANSEQSTLALLNDTVDLTDGSNGSVRGIVNSVSIRDRVATVDGDARTGLLVAFRDVAPFSGTLEGAFTYYFSLAEITTDFIVDTAIASRAVAYQGWSGDLWQGLKEICATEQIEIAQVSGLLVVRPLRSRTLEVLKESRSSASVENRNLARNAEVEWYEGDYTATPVHVYPRYDDENSQVWQVNANSSLIADLPVYMSMLAIDPPEPVDSVADGYLGTDSVYSIIDREANAYPADLWTALGGSITAMVLPDTKTARITITGPDDLVHGPFRIAQRSAPGDENDTSTRPTLHLAASGVVAIPRTLSQPTGAPDSKTARESAPTTKATFANTLSKAWSVLTGLAGAYAEPTQVISADATIVNRRGEPGGVGFATFADFNAAFTGMTFSAFNTAHTGDTFADLNAEMLALTASDFENQAFGNVAGARVRREDAFYRVASATITPEGISYTAVRDTTFGDFNTEWAGATFATFNAEWAGAKFGDLDIAPLRKA
jgi:hypothetical protein